MSVSQSDCSQSPTRRFMTSLTNERHGGNKARIEEAKAWPRSSPFAGDMVVGGYGSLKTKPPDRGARRDTITGMRCCDGFGRPILTEVGELLSARGRCDLWRDRERGDSLPEWPALLIFSERCAAHSWPTTDSPICANSFAVFLYHSARNQFERFRGVLGIN